MTTSLRYAALVAMMAAITVFTPGCAPDPTEDKTPMRVNEPAEPTAPAEVTEPTEPVEPGESSSAKTYTIDSTVSAITFTGSKVTGTHSGGWTGYSGTITVPGDDFTAAQIAIEIDMSTTFSDDVDLTKTLQGEQFFDAATYPTSTFTSTGIAATDDGFDVSGDLTLHGVTKNITFPATVTLGDDDLTAEAEFSFNRKLFDIVYDGKADDLIRDDVLMTFYIEAKAS